MLQGATMLQGLSRFLKPMGTVTTRLSAATHMAIGWASPLVGAWVVHGLLNRSQHPPLSDKKPCITETCCHDFPQRVGRVLEDSRLQKHLVLTELNSHSRCSLARTPRASLSTKRKLKTQDVPDKFDTSSEVSVLCVIGLFVKVAHTLAPVMSACRTRVWHIERESRFFITDVGGKVPTLLFSIRTCLNMQVFFSARFTLCSSMVVGRKLSAAA